MITKENGEYRYFDKNGVEITEGCTIRYPHGDLSLVREERVYRTEDGELGTDATNKGWVASGKAAPCEYGIYPLTAEETDSVEVVGPVIERDRVFQHYMDRLVKECGEVHGHIRFNVVEYLCGFPDIDPVEMAAALKLDGYQLVFDDASISRTENKRKERLVGARVGELSKAVDTVDGLIAGAAEAVSNTRQEGECVEHKANEQIER